MKNICYGFVLILFIQFFHQVTSIQLEKTGDDLLLKFDNIIRENTKPPQTQNLVVDKVAQSSNLENNITDIIKNLLNSKNDFNINKNSDNSNLLNNSSKPQILTNKLDNNNNASNIKINIQINKNDKNKNSVLDNVNPEIIRIKRLFENKIKLINKRNSLSKSTLDNSQTILKHIYLGENSPLESMWKFDTEKEKFIIPSEIQNEDDWNKYLRIISLLNSMSFSKDDVKNETPIINPPIIYTEGEKKINSFQITSNFVPKGKSKNFYSFKSQDVENKTNQKIENPPNFLFDV